MAHGLSNCRPLHPSKSASQSTSGAAQINKMLRCPPSSDTNYPISQQCQWIANSGRAQVFFRGRTSFGGRRHIRCIELASDTPLNELIHAHHIL